MSARGRASPSALARIPQGELVVIAGSRHLVSIDRPAELNAALLRFLRERGGADPV